MASDVQAKAGLEAEADRLGARFGLGQRTGSWSEKGYLTRVLMGWVWLGVVALAGVGYLQAMHGRDAMMGGGGELLGGFVIGVVMVAIPPRARRIRLFLFEDGAVRISNLGPPLRVLPWADLESMSLTVVAGYDHTYVSNCVLRGRSGTTLTVSRHDSGPGRGAVVAAAEAVIAERLAGSLVRQFDAGQPITFGFFAVDRSGIRSRGPSEAGGRWQVSWDQVRGVETVAHGQRVLVTSGRRSGKRAELDNIPNSCLARPVLEHAARQAGVSFTAT